MQHTSQLIGSAYHEAGHVIAFRHHNFRVDWVEVSSENSGFMGSPDGDFDSICEKVVGILCYAGMQAESKVRPDGGVSTFGDIVSGARSDRLAVDKKLMERWKAISPLTYQTHHNAAQKFIETHWKDIERVANALLAKSANGFPMSLDQNEIEAAINSL